MSDTNLIAIFGPTGVGKTAVAIALADRLRARGEDPVAVSADALQLYRGLERLTGAADATEQARLEHRLIACVPLSESFSAGRYAALAHAEIDGLRAAGRRPILVGGTGLYLRAALTELALEPPVDPAVRAALSARLAVEGAAALHAELASRRPELAAAIAPGDAQRVTRMLELLEVGREPRTRGPGRADPAGAQELWSDRMRIPTHLYGLTLEREALRAAIDRRIDAMLAAGVEAEVRAAAAAGPVGTSAAKALGFRELLDGDVETMRIRTRQYARRQLTWMRKLAGVTTLDLTGRDPAWAAEQILLGLAPR